MTRTKASGPKLPGRWADEGVRPSMDFAND